MTVGSNLSLRLATIMILGFVALQVLIIAAAFPGGDEGREKSYGLPHPQEITVLADALDHAPAGQRDALVAALDGGGLYAFTLATGPTRRWRSSAWLEDVAAHYRAAVPDRPIRVDSPRPRLSRWIGGRARLARFLAPIRLSVGLRDGSVLLVKSELSPELRAYRQRRALTGALVGLALLIVLMLAVHQTTRPLAALSRGVRDFADNLDAPDLPEKGPAEVRELAVAFNDMKAQVRGALAERTRVLGAIAHDLRTYLTRLRLRAEFIGDPEHHARAVRDLDEMTALVNDTLFLADRDTAPPAQPEPMPLAAVLQEIVDAHLELGDSVILAPVPDDYALLATPLAFRRVLDNLIINGLRHGSSVTIAADIQEALVDIIVADDGPGVPLEALSRLGLPFQRFDPSRSRETGGAGLGLAIVRALATRDQAEVIFEQALPHGLQVILRYPRAATVGNAA